MGWEGAHNATQAFANNGKAIAAEMANTLKKIENLNKGLDAETKEQQKQLSLRESLAKWFKDISEKLKLMLEPVTKWIRDKFESIKSWISTAF
jgi:DNA topoisomerase VI subunit B